MPTFIACHLCHSQSMQYDAITVSLHCLPQYGTPLDNGAPADIYLVISIMLVVFSCQKDAGIGPIYKII